MDEWKRLFLFQFCTQFMFINVGIQQTFLRKNLEDIILFVGPLIPLFWISGDIHPGFQSQGGSLTCILHDLHVMGSSDSPLV